MRISRAYKRVIASLFIFILSSTSIILSPFNESIKDGVDSYFYQEITLNYFSERYENKVKLDSINYDGIHYLTKEDFITLCNMINKEVRQIKDISNESFISNGSEINIAYRSDASFAINYLKGIISASSFRSINRLVSGENVLIKLKLNDLLLHPIHVEGEVYYPLDIIRYNIFSGESYLVRTKDDYYEILGESAPSLANSGNAYFLNEINDYSEKVDYKLSYNLTRQLLRDTNGYYTPIIDISSIVNYTDLYQESVKLLDSQEDYQVEVLMLQQNLDEENLGTNSLLMNLDSKLPVVDEDGHTIFSERLYRDAYYIKINTFDIEESLFFSQLNKMYVDLRKNEGIENVIIDLRDNPGGSTINTGFCFEKFINSKFTIRTALIVYGEEIGDQEFEYARDNPIEKMYDYTIILNEYSKGNSVVFANIMKENMQSLIIGREPIYKQTSHKTLLQTLEGTQFTWSCPNYAFITEDGKRLDNAVLVDIIKRDIEIIRYLESF